MINLGFVKFSSFRMMFWASERTFVIHRARRRVFNISQEISEENISAVFRFLKGRRLQKGLKSLEDVENVEELDEEFL